MSGRCGIEHQPAQPLGLVLDTPIIAAFKLKDGKITAASASAPVRIQKPPCSELTNRTFGQGPTTRTQRIIFTFPPILLIRLPGTSSQALAGGKAARNSRQERSGGPS
jgi:hypothetical protein